MDGTKASTTRLTSVNQNRSGTTGVISAGSNLAACLNDYPGEFLASIEDLKSGSTLYLTVWPPVLVIESCCQTNCTVKSSLPDSPDGEDSDVDIDSVVNRAMRESSQKSAGTPPYSPVAPKSDGSDDDSDMSGNTGKLSPTTLSQDAVEPSTPTGATPGPCVDGPVVVKSGYKYNVIVRLVIHAALGMRPRHM